MKEIITHHRKSEQNQHDLHKSTWNQHESTRNQHK